jgi:hypothetical protein
MINKKPVKIAENQALTGVEIFAKMSVYKK